MTVELTKDTFDDEVIKSNKPVIVDFWAEWCGPCKVLAPRFEELSKEMPNIKFLKVNVDENQELSAKYGIRSIPTLLMFKDGKVVGTIIGAMSKESLKDKIEKVFGK